MEASFGKYDELLLGILKEQKHFHGFFDTIFGFLYRCSDFYQVSTDCKDVAGLPPGISEQVIQYYYKKWSDKGNLLVEPVNEIDDVEISDVVHQEEVISTDHKVSAVKCEEISIKSITKDDVTSNISSECFNGSRTAKYSWSQSITDIDVNVLLPINVKSAKQLIVKIESKHLHVAAVGVTEFLVDGDLPWGCRNADVIWSISNGVLQIHLDKQRERWWDQLLITEPKINLNSVDCSRPLEDLSEEAQAKIQELRWNQEQKLQGKPTSEQLKHSKLLKKAWNLEGSPFKGTEFDPSIIQFNQDNLN